MINENTDYDSFLYECPDCYWSGGFTDLVEDHAGYSCCPGCGKPEEELIYPHFDEASYPEPIESWVVDVGEDLGDLDEGMDDAGSSNMG